MPETPFPKDPISRVEWLPAASLKANWYNPNNVMTPELRLLERSLLQTGWVQPIMISRDGTIVDGFHRCSLARDSKALQKKYGGMVPCVRMDLDEAEAMVHTIRMNRAKGSHSALHMSTIVKTLIDTHHLDPQEVAVEIGATRDEVDLLYQDGIFKHRNLANAPYSKAWVPAESREAAPRKGKA